MPFEIEGVDELKKLIRDIEGAMDPNAELMGEVGRAILRSIDKTFATNGRGTWAKNSPKTKEGKPGVLQFEGSLRSKMKLEVGKNFAEVRPENSVYKYAAINQIGTARIPSRPFMLLWPEDLEEIMRVYKKPLDEVMR